VRPALPIALLVLAALLAGCGGSGEDPPPFTPPSSSSEGAAHIHGLGINPADDSLFIATHTGLFRAAANERRARRVGDTTQDTMGFTVVGADEFLGSGHPDARASLPPLLGLIRSADAGRSWKPISLLGEADFHVLRTAGSRIYGVNATDGRLMLSADGGRTWARRTPPSGLIDLAADPRDADRLVASAEDRLMRSADGGRSWRPLSARAGLLAWPAKGDLFLLDASGAVWTSPDAGRTWKRVGELGGPPAALATHGDDLYVALHTNEVKVSRDGGGTWTLRAQP
jgi:photosystem II stability/assembly factor-like uncharacterized protein